MDAMASQRSSDGTHPRHETEDGVFLMHVLILYWSCVRGAIVLFTLVFSGDKRVWGDRVRGTDSAVDCFRSAFFFGGGDSDFVCGVLYAVYDFGDDRVYDWTGITDDVGG